MSESGQRDRPVPPAVVGAPDGYGREPGPATFGIVGAAFVTVGAILGIVAFTALDWFDSGGFTLSKVRSSLVGHDSAGDVETLAKLYFDWLAWVLLAGAVVLALAATLPTAAAHVLRVTGAVTGLGGAVVTLLAVRISSANTFRQYLQHAGVGFYVALAGFLLIAVGAVSGPQRG